MFLKKELRRHERALIAWCVLTLTIAGLYNACSREGFSAASSSSGSPTAQSAPSITGLILINGGAPYTRSTAVTLSLGSSGAKEMYITNTSDCSNGGIWQSFNKTTNWVLPEKNRPVAVFAKFRSAQGMESDCVGASIFHDDTAPAIVIDKTVAPLTNQTFVGIDFHAVDVGSGVNNLYCISPGQISAEPCLGSYTGKKLQEGGYVVKFLADDNAGNVSPLTTIQFTVDTTPPVVTLNSMPPVVVGSSDALFAFSGSDNISGVQRFECALDGVIFSSCSSPINYRSLPQGNHSFSVRAFDGAGNGSSVVSYNWMIDLTAPTVTITETPKAQSGSGSGHFAFTGVDDKGQSLAQFQCRIDNGAFAVCSSPSAFSGLKEGRHTFGVKGTNVLGIESSEVTYSWLIDLTPPVVTISQGPALLTNLTDANFVFAVSDNLSGVVSVSCSLDGLAGVACNDLVKSYSNLSGDTQHSFQVTAVDGAGNVAQSPLYTWTIDVTPPTLQIVAHPDLLSSMADASFQLKGSDLHGPVTYQCQLDADPVMMACGSDVAYKALSDGAHTFFAQAVDAVGNRSDKLSFSWKIETVGPVIQFTQTPKPQVLTTDASAISYVITDSISTVQTVKCMLDSNVVACTNPNGTVQIPPQAAGGHEFSVTATNAAGISSTASYSFKAVAPSCVTTVNTTTVLTKMLFVIDTSGSNGSSNCTLGPLCTDAGKKMRGGSIQAFYNDYGAKPNFAWGFNIFQGSGSTALINNGTPSQPMFSDSKAMQNAITSFMAKPDSGGTPYMAALNLATQSISNDPDLNSAKKPQYIVVFMSDGQPDGGADSAAAILTQVKSLVGLSAGRISLNTVYYGPVNAVASGLLQNMANTGNGNFLNTNTNPTGLSFKISDLVSVPVTVCQ